MLYGEQKKIESVYLFIYIFNAEVYKPGSDDASTRYARQRECGGESPLPVKVLLHYDYVGIRHHSYATTYKEKDKGVGLL